jgi:hypothetical protein
MGERPCRLLGRLPSSTPFLFLEALGIESSGESNGHDYTVSGCLCHAPEEFFAVAPGDHRANDILIEPTPCDSGRAPAS